MITNGKLMDQKLEERSKVVESINKKNSGIINAEEEKFSLTQRMNKLKAEIEHVKIDMNFDERKVRKMTKKVVKKKEKNREKAKLLEEFKQEHEKLKSVSVKVIRLANNLDKNRN